MTLMLERPTPVRPWWHIRPAERRPLALILGVGGPTGFALGALLGIFLQVPGPTLPALPAAGRGMPVTTSVAPPEPRSKPSPARPPATGSDAATRRAARADVAHPAASSPAGRAPTAPTIRTTVTVTSTPPTTPPSTPPTTEGSAPEGGVSLSADPS